MKNIPIIYRIVSANKFIVLLLAFFLLGACTDIQEPTPLCVGNDDLSKVVKNSVTVEATNSLWVDTGITALTGVTYNIGTIGSVMLCSGASPEASCAGINGKFMQLYVGQLSNGLPSDSTKIIDIGTENGMYTGTSDISRKIYVHLNDTDNDYTASAVGIDHFNFLQCKVTGFKAKQATSNPSDSQDPYAYCVNSINAYTYINSPVERGHKIAKDIATNDTTNTIMCQVTGVEADDGTISPSPSTTSPSPSPSTPSTSPLPSTKSSADNCLEYLNSRVSLTTGSANLSACSVTSFLSSSDANKTACVYALNGIGLGVTLGQGTVSGESVCKVPVGGATGSSSGVGSTGNCVNDINTKLEKVLGSKSTTNSGSYLVTVKTSKAPDINFSDFIDGIVSPIRNIIQGKDGTPGMSQVMYENVASNNEFINGVRAFIVLSIVFFSFRYMVGLSHAGHKELVSLIIRMSLVLTMISPGSWLFFSTYLFQIYLNGTDELTYIMSHNINDLVARGFYNVDIMSASTTTSGADQGKAVFGFLNYTLSILFSKEANIKLSAIFFAWPLGPIICIVVYMGVMYFLIAIGKTLFTYITSIIMVGVLLALAPLFISFLMFEKTKAMFDRWLKLMGTFALQPVLLLVLMSVFNIFILVSLYNILNFTACYGCAWKAKLPLLGEICFLNAYVPWGLDPSQTIAQKLTKTPIGLFYALQFIIFTNMLASFTRFVDNLAATLVSDGTGSSLGSAVSRATGTLGAAASQIAHGAKDTALFTGRSSLKVMKAANSGLGMATGYSATDAAKIAARNAMWRMGMKTEGQVDETGRKMKISERFMTSRERKGYKRDLEEFRNLGNHHADEFTKLHQDNKNIKEFLVLPQKDKNLQEFLSSRNDKKLLEAFSKFNAEKQNIVIEKNKAEIKQREGVKPPTPSQLGRELGRDLSQAKNSSEKKVMLKEYKDKLNNYFTDRKKNAKTLHKNYKQDAAAEAKELGSAGSGSKNFWIRKLIPQQYDKYKANKKNIKEKYDKMFDGE